MDWNGRDVLVTGAGGFIGSHLTERLLDLGANVRAMVHGDPLFHPGFLSPRDGLELTGGDLRDADFVRRSVEGMDTVFHLGAVTSVAYSYTHPEETVATNILGTLNVCTAARGAGIRRLVHTSSAGVYGDAQDDRPISEDHPVMGANPYTAGKLGGDIVVQTHYLSYDLPATTVRLFNVFGPRMGRYLIMPTIIQQLIEGTELHLGDLTPTRTFTYVDDIVAGFLAMGEADGVLGEVVHFGAQEVVSMAELVQRIADVMGRDYTIVQDPDRLRPKKSEIYRIRVDSGKARRLLGWHPQTGLDEGLRRTILWLRNAYEAPEK